VLILGLAATGLNVFSGWTSRISLGHAAFFGIGGYSVALLAFHFDIPVIAGWIAGVVVAVVAALVLGWPALRARRWTLAVLSLAVAEGLRVTLAAGDWTGGTAGITGTPRVIEGGTADLGTETGLYYLALLLVIGVSILAWRIQRSALGLAIRAVRSATGDAERLGIGSVPIHLGLLALSAAIVAAAGGLAAQRMGGVVPQVAGFDMSLTILVALLAGGIDSRTGPLLGALAVVLFRMFTPLPASQLIVVEGLAAIVLLALAPHGLMGLYWRWLDPLLVRVTAGLPRKARLAPQRPARWMGMRTALADEPWQ
jgi:branched-chain amino acid transport system permease protein